MSDRVKYKVYYSLSPTGPWTLANDTLIENNNTGNHYRITGLRNNVQYYVMVVAGRLVDGEWKALASQPIRPTAESGTETINPNIILTKTFSI